MALGLSLRLPSPGSAKRNLINRLAWLSGGRVVAALLQSVSMVLLIRETPSAQFGFFSAVFGVLTVGQTACDIGVSTYIVRERARCAESGAVSVAVKLCNWLSILLFSTFFIGFFIGGALGEHRFFALLPLALWASAERNGDTLLGVVFSDGDVWINTSTLVVRRIVGVLLFLLSTFLAVPSLIGYSSSVAIAAVGSAIFAQIYVRRRLPPVDDTTPRQVLAYSWPYWLASVASQARNLDVAVVSFVGSAFTAGIYSVVSRLTVPLRLLPSSLASLLLPIAAKKNSSTMAPMVWTVLIGAAVMTLIFFVVALLIPWVIPPLLGAGYVSSIPALQIACVGLVFASTASLLSALLQGVGLRHFSAGSEVVMTVVCLAGIAIGTWFAGAIGAAVGLTAGYLAQVSMMTVRLLLFITRKEPNR